MLRILRPRKLPLATRRILQMLLPSLTMPWKRPQPMLAQTMPPSTTARQPVRREKLVASTV